MQQPEKVRQTIQKVATDGVLSTVEAVRSKLSEPIPLGYCNVGIVEVVGDKVDEFSVGDQSLVMLRMQNMRSSLQPDSSSVTMWTMTKPVSQF